MQIMTNQAAFDNSLIILCKNIQIKYLFAINCIKIFKKHLQIYEYMMI